jgi:AcrR family transcriptional regulator
MPKIPAPPEVVSSIRENIIMEAAALINEVGYSDFSMRRLGSRLGVAAKTIYNYFTDKDELYLLIVTKGFEILFHRFQEAYSATDDP